MDQHYTELQIIEDIRSGGLARENAWRYVSKNWGSYCCGTAIKSSGCNAKQAVEAFSIAVIGTDKRILSPDGSSFLRTASLKSYLTQSTVYAARGLLSKGFKYGDLNDGESFKENADDWFSQKNCREIMENSLAFLGERCKKILLMFNDNFNMKEIADEMGYSNENVAKKEKYKCQGNFKDYLRANPSVKNLLKENCYG